MCSTMLLYCLFVGTAVQVVAGFVKMGNGETNVTGCELLSNLFQAVKLLSTNQQVLVVLPTTFRCQNNLLTEKVDVIATWSCSDPINLSGRVDDSPAIIALLCDMKTNVRLVANATNRTEHQWLIMAEHEINEVYSFAAVFNEFHVNSNLFFFTGNNSLNFYDVFCLDPQDGLVVQQTQELFFRVERRRGNFGGITLKITAVSTPTYHFDSNIELNAHGNLILHPSFSVAKLQVLASVLNFTPEIKLADVWGSYNSETKQWTGMVGDILEGKADIALTQASEVPDRQAVVDFTFSTSTWKLCAYFRKPPNKIALLHPFQKSLWCALLAWICCTSVSSLIFRYILNRWGDCETQIRVDFRSAKVILRATVDSFLWATGMLCNQGLHKVPNHSCLQILDFVGHITAFVVFVAYSGVLIAFLSVAVKDSIDSIEELLAMSYSLIIDGNPLLFNLLKGSSLFDHASVTRLLRLGTNLTGLDDFRGDMMRGGFAFVTEDAPAYYSLRKDFSEEDVVLIGDACMQFGLNGLGSMIAKKSPYKRFINYQILRFKQHGIISLWRRRYWPESLTYDTISFDGVDLTSVSAAFILYTHTLVLSIGILLIECLLGRKKRRRNRDKNDIELRHQVCVFTRTIHVRPK